LDKTHIRGKDNIDTTQDDFGLTKPAIWESDSSGSVDTSFEFEGLSFQKPEEGIRIARVWKRRPVLSSENRMKRDCPFSIEPQWEREFEQR